MVSATVRSLLTTHSHWLDQEIAERSLQDFIRQHWLEMGERFTYKDNWHIEKVCDHLKAVTDGDLKRLIINIPPRHMKSLSVSVAWPAWTWIHKPGTRFMYSSYSADLSMRDSLKCRMLIASPRYQSQWGHKFRVTAPDNMRKFQNSEGGYRMSTSVQGKLTGEGGDIIVIDDAHNAVEGESDTVRQATLEWWDRAMSTAPE